MEFHRAVQPATTYHIMNADLMEQCEGQPSPSATVRGQRIKLLTEVQACPWKINRHKLIPPGVYEIVSRKGFTGGSQEIKPVGARS